MPSRIPASGLPRVAAHSRVTFDQVRGQYVLLGPESVSVLNHTGAAILTLCDGEHSVAQIIEELHGTYAHVQGDEVREFIARLVDDRSVRIDQEVVDG